MLGFGFVHSGKREVERGRGRGRETVIGERREMVLSYIFYCVDILF